MLDFLVGIVALLLITAAIFVFIGIVVLLAVNIYRFLRESLWH